MTATVPPPEKRSCRACINYDVLGGGEGHCQLFDELVKHPRERAARCNSWELDAWWEVPDGEDQ